MGILWVKGYTVLEVDSFCAERFFNLCMNRGILVHDLQPESDKCTFATSVQDYYKLKPVVRKTRPHIKLKQKKRFSVCVKRYIEASVLYCRCDFVCHGHACSWTVYLEYKT